MLRYVVAISAAVAMSWLQLRLSQRRGPWGDRRQKALAYWMALVSLDAAVAWLATYAASKTGSGSAGDLLGWAAIGLFVPLGLRSPVWKNQKYFGREFDAGFTVLWDICRQLLLKGLEERMNTLRRAEREHLMGAARDNGWTSALMLVLVEEHLTSLHNSDEADIDQRLEQTYLAMGADEETVRILGLADVIIDGGYSSLREHLCQFTPMQHHHDRMAGAHLRAEQFVASRRAVAELTEQTAGRLGVQEDDTNAAVADVGADAPLPAASAPTPPAVGALARADVVVGRNEAWLRLVLRDLTFTEVDCTVAADGAAAVTSVVRYAVADAPVTVIYPTDFPGLVPATGRHTYEWWVRDPVQPRVVARGEFVLTAPNSET